MATAAAEADVPAAAVARRRGCHAAQRTTVAEGAAVWRVARAGNAAGSTLVATMDAGRNRAGVPAAARLAWAKGIQASRAC